MREFRRWRFLLATLVISSSLLGSTDAQPLLPTQRQSKKLIIELPGGPPQHLCTVARNGAIALRRLVVRGGQLFLTRARLGPGRTRRFLLQCKKRKGNARAFPEIVASASEFSAQQRGSLCHQSDFNNDRIVDVSDMGILLSLFGTEESRGDLDRDGYVGLFDIALFLSVFGCSPDGGPDIEDPTPAPSPTPLPDPNPGDNQPPVAEATSLAVTRNSHRTFLLRGFDPEEMPLAFTIVRGPQHGQLVGEPPRVTYIPVQDYIGSDTFEFIVRDELQPSAPATVSIAVVARSFPIGIPPATFGFEESHLMYRGLNYDFGAGPVPYPESASGPYTHYVDNTDPDATDLNNPYGNVERPRMTPPRDIQAGSVVEIHGGPYDYHPGPSGEFLFNGAGTPDRPIFIRGPSIAVRPRFHHPLLIGFYNLNNYSIIENLDIYGSTVSQPRDGVESTHHIAIRNCRLMGSVSGGGSGIGGTLDKPTHNIVFHGNIVTANGDWQNGGDRDIHGLAIGGGTHQVWVIDNEFSYNEGDGVQVNSNPDSFAHHIYLGGNISHHNKQTGLWTKYARDVIFSQNTAFGHRPSSSAGGGGLGFQYGPERVWFIFNHIFDNELGIASGSPSGPGFDGDGVHSYYIGNLIHDIHHSQSEWNPSGTPDCINGSAICLRAGPVRYLIHNTIFDVDAGISAMSGAATRTHILNNIISNISGISYSHHLRIDDRSGGDGIRGSNIDRNLFYQLGGPSEIRIVTGMNYTSGLTLPQFRSQFPTQCVNCWDSENPGFVDAQSHDFHLSASSASRDRGEEHSVYETFLDTYGIDLRVDIEGNPRPFGGGWDLGAYEYSE